jgi:YggT family protein
MLELAKVSSARGKKMFDVVVRIFADVLIAFVIIKVFLSYFLAPDNKIRYILDQMVEPLLAPIRKLMPASMGLDFSPIILILLIQIVQVVLIRLF